MIRALAFLILAAQPSGFEAASIRPTAVDPDSFPSYKTDPVRIAYTNVTLRDCIGIAWRVRDYQIEAPKSIDSFRFDLVANTSAPASEDRMRMMLRTLLIERFGMKVREETRELPGYALTAGGKTKLTPSAANREFSQEWGMGKISFSHVTMKQFAEILSGYVSRTVIDNTGLSGSFDVSLAISDDPADAKRIMRGGEVGDLIVSTIQSQLGLRLEPRRGPAKVLIVDHAERTPIEN